MDEYLAEVQMTICQLEERIEILGLEFSPETYFEMNSEMIEQKLRDATSTKSVTSTLPITRPTTVITTTTTEETTTTTEATTTTETTTEETTESRTIEKTETTTSTASMTSTVTTTTSADTTPAPSPIAPTTRPRLLQPPGIDMLNTLLTNMLDSVTTAEPPTQFAPTNPDMFTYSMLPTTVSLTVSSLMSSTVSTSVSPTIVSVTVSTTATSLSPTATPTQSVELTSSTNVVHVLEGEPITTMESVTFGTNNVTNGDTMVTTASLIDEATFVTNIVTSSAADENILVLEMTTDTQGEI